jgi:excisionase family DNA binding protein
VTTNDDFVSFDKALRELNIQSDELKRLVSEGEIRAFRDGDSMKFKREDIESLLPEEQEELVFADGLEDDTGMVTEELSDEDTLLADDDLLDDEPAAAPAPKVSRTPARSRARADAQEEESEPVWGAVAAALAFVLLLWGSFAVWSLKNETPPSGVLGMFAQNGE